MPVRQATLPRSTPPAFTPAPMPSGGFPTGAQPSSRRGLMMAWPFTSLTYPTSFGVVPAKLSYWGNNQYGDCVSAEEAFAKAAHSPEIFIDDATVIAWARKNGVLNGAMLDDVLDKMHADGYHVGPQIYNDGDKLAVDYSNEDNLRSAIAAGTVKIAMASSALPSGAGNVQGWYAFGKKSNRGSDHCTALTGYGTAGQCFAYLGVPLPSGVDGSKSSCYLHFTWSTIGVVDHDWLMGTCDEAWVRNPTTVGVPPLPDLPLDPTQWA